MGSTRKRINDSIDRLLSEGDPLDADEQQLVIKDLEASQRKQERWGSVLLSALIALVSVLHFYIAWEQVIEPWSTKVSAFFYGALPAQAVSGGLLLSSLAYGCSAVNVLGVWKEKLGTSFGAFVTVCAFISAIFWTTGVFCVLLLHNEGVHTAAKFWWLPFGPLAVTILVAHFQGMLRRNLQDISTLKSQTYTFKKL